MPAVRRIRRQGAHQGGGAADNLALEVVLRAVAGAHELVLVLRRRALQCLSQLHRFKNISPSSLQGAKVRTLSSLHAGGLCAHGVPWHDAAQVRAHGCRSTTTPSSSLLPRATRTCAAPNTSIALAAGCEPRDLSCPAHKVVAGQPPRRCAEGKCIPYLPATQRSPQ